MAAEPQRRYKRTMTRPDLLLRFDGLPGSPTQAKFEKANGLNSGLIKAFREGRYRSAEGHPAQEAFEKAIILAEAGLPPEPEPREEKSKARSRVTDPGVEKELLAMIKDADTIEKKLALSEHIMGLNAIGKVTTEFARFSNDSLNRQQGLLKMKAEADAIAKAGEPVQIVIKYVNDWG